MYTCRRTAAGVMSGTLTAQLMFSAPLTPKEENIAFYCTKLCKHDMAFLGQLSLLLNS